MEVVLQHEGIFCFFVLLELFLSHNHANLGHVNFLQVFCFPNIEVSWLNLKVWGSVRPSPAKVDHMHIFEPALLLEYD